MSECVVRMEFPLNCLECPMYDWNRQKLCCNAHLDLRPIPNGGVPKPDWCPIICQLPEGHGRLVDADANIETMKKCSENTENAQALLCYSYAQRILEEAPTVEPASPWHRVEDGLPNDKQYVLFVVHTPPYHSTEMGDIPDMKKVVYGYFSLSQRRGRRYWSWEDEIGECVIANEFSEDEDGGRTYITHWMPLPEPPKEET